MNKCEIVGGDRLLLCVNRFFLLTYHVYIYICMYTHVYVCMYIRIYVYTVYILCIIFGKIIQVNFNKFAFFGYWSHACLIQGCLFNRGDSFFYS